MRNRFYKRIEKDKDFFTYYNVTTAEAIQLAETQANGYIIDAIDKLTDIYTPKDVDFYNFDDTLEIFNFDLTNKEIGLLIGLMYEVYFERDLVLLKAFKIAMTPSDLNQFSPASERKTFTEMVESIKQDNIIKIDNYSSVDRITGIRKVIDHSKYEY
jgi:uncharacterized protein YrrD